MADLTRTVAVLFNAEDKLSPAITSMEKRLNAFGDVAGGIAKPLANMADAVLKVDAALAAFAVGGLAYAYTKSMQFETASVNLSKILGEQKDQIGFVEQSVLDLSNKYGQAASSVLNSTTDFKKAGFAVDEALQLTETGIGLVIGAAEAELGVAESTEIIIAALKGFNAPASEAARLTDILNTVSNEYATSVTELGIGMATLAPIAHKMGFSFEETAGILTPVIEIFRSGDEASTALKMGLMKLIDDAKPVQDALKSIGVAQKDSNGNLRSGRDILMDVAEAFKTADEDSKLYLTGQLVGIRQAAKMVTVFDGLAKTTEITGRALASSGSIAQEVAQKLLTSEIAVNRFKAGFENLGIVVGDQFRIAATEAINGGTEIENALQKIVSDGTFKPIFDALSKFADDLGDFLSDMAKAMPEAFEKVKFEEVIEALGGLGDSFATFFDGLDLTKPGDLAKAIQGVVDTITSFINTTTGMTEAFKPVWDSIKSMISGFNELDVETQKSSGGILGSAKVVSEAGVKIVAAIILIGDGAEKLSGAFKIIVDTITGAFQASLSVWNGLELAFINIVDDMLAVSQVFDKIFLFGSFSEDIASVRKDLAEWGKETEKAMKEAGVSAVKHLTGINLSLKATGKTAVDSKKEIGDFAKTVKELPEAQQTAIKILLEAGEIETVSKFLMELPNSKQVDIKTKIDKGTIKSIMSALGEVPAWKQVEIMAYLNAGDLKEAIALIDNIPAEKVTEVTAEADEKQINDIAEYIIETLPDGHIVITQAQADKKSLEKVKKEVDDALDPLKLLEIQADIDIEKIKAAAEIMQTQIEWDAKINIAGIEADVEKVKAAFDSISDSVSAVSDTVGSMFGSLAGVAGSIHFYELFDALNREMDMQEKLITAQIGLLRERTNAIKSGQPARVQIDSANLTPALEMVFGEILSAIQVTANAEGMAFLGL